MSEYYFYGLAALLYFSTCWTFSAANGTLLLQNKQRKSGINIGVNGYSYYSINNGEVKGENSLKFSPKAVLATMKRI